MPTTPKKIYLGQPGNTAGTIYTVPTATVTIVRHIRCVNKDVATAYDLELWLNGSADANAIIAKKTIPPGGEWEDDCYIALPAADYIQAKASTAAKLTVYIGGAEIT